MRRVFFLYPRLGVESGGHVAQWKFMEIAKAFCDAQPVTYQSREDGALFLDDVLSDVENQDAIYFVHWGPHISNLIARLTGRNCVYTAHSIGWGLDIPPSVPILCVSRHIQAHWGRRASNAMILHLPNQIADCFQNDNRPRTIDVLVHARKSSDYLLNQLVPALRDSCEVRVLDSWVDNLPDIFNASKVYLYDSSDHWGEGFGLQPLEALACGCTVFSSINDGLSDFMDPGFNCHKLRVYSTQYDVDRILRITRNWDESSDSIDDYSFYRGPNIRARFERILLELNDFFDMQRGAHYVQDIPANAGQGKSVVRACAARILPNGIKQYLKQLVG